MFGHTLYHVLVSRLDGLLGLSHLTFRHLRGWQDFGVQSMVDAPCGDLAWMQEVDLQGAQYLGVDIVPQLIADNQQRFVSRPDMSFRVLDIVRQAPPAADLIFCRETLQHLTQGDALRALINFSNSGARCVQCALSSSRSSQVMSLCVLCSYLMTTTFLEIDDNAIRFDVAHGFYSINLLKSPFNLPPPIRLYVDNAKTREYLAVRLFFSRLPLLYQKRLAIVVSDLAGVLTLNFILAGVGVAAVGMISSEYCVESEHPGLVVCV